jgi:hypothetical protein
LPWLDVSDIVLDPVIAGESFDVYHRTQTVDQNGVARIAQALVPGVRGSVIPVGANSLARDDAYQTQAKAIRVITAARLRGASKQDSDGSVYQPDVISWKGDFYVVKSLDDYSQYGAGLVVAECVSLSFVPEITT